MTNAIFRIELKFEVLYLLGFVLLLTGFGAVMVLSATAAFETNYFVRHLFSLALGFIGLGLVWLTPLSFLRINYRLFFFVAILLAVATLTFGVEVNGAQRWLRLGGFSFQISEWGKIFLGIYLCGHLAQHQEKINDDPKLFLVPILILSFFSAMLVLQPDLGSAVVLLLSALCLVFVAGMKLRYFFMLVMLFLLVLFFLIVLSSYRLERITGFLDPWEDRLDSGWQLTQALIAFGRGEWFGEGIGSGVQKLFYLPEAHNDFILAVVAEELGIIGCWSILIIFGLFVGKIFGIASRCFDQELNFAGLITYFISCLFALQILINVGVATGVMPTKGLTLPFISYGGNSIIVSLLLVGIVFRSLKELEAHGRN